MTVIIQQMVAMEKGRSIEQVSWTVQYFYPFLLGKPFERGSTFGTVFLDCPESRPLFYSQSPAIQGFCRDKLSVSR